MSDSNLGFCCSVVVGVAAALAGALITSTPPGVVQVWTLMWKFEDQLVVPIMLT